MPLQMSGEKSKFKARKWKMSWLKWLKVNIREIIMASEASWMAVREGFGIFVKLASPIVISESRKSDHWRNYLYPVLVWGDGFKETSFISYILPSGLATVNT